MRQTQQHACYAAEAALDSGVRFADVAAAQKFVDDLRDAHWWHLQEFSLHVLRIEVGATRKKCSVGWYDRDKSAGRIELTRDGMCVKTALHEVAHVLAEAVHGSKSHDPAWARTYLTLVCCVLGSTAYVELQMSFDRHGVSYDVQPGDCNKFAL